MYHTATVLEEITRDHVYQWLINRQDIETVAVEVTIPDGRIDLLAENQNGEYIGFEVKYHGEKQESQGYIMADTFEQLDRYRNSGVLDYLYYCAPTVEPYIDRIESAEAQIAPSLLSQLRKDLNAAVAAGNLDAEKVKADVIRQLPKSIRRASSGYQSSRMETIEKFFINGVSGRRKGGTELRNTDLTFEEVAEQIRENAYDHPVEVGVVRVPTVLRHDRDSGGQRFPTVDGFEKLLHPDKTPDPEIVREANHLLRESQPTLSTRNEATIGGWIGKEFEDYERNTHTIREGVLPHPEEPMGRIDVLVYYGSLSARVLRENQEVNQYDLHGIEVKGKEIGDTRSSVRDQLKMYATSGCLTKLSLAVPEEANRDAREILSQSIDDPIINKIGLITISTDMDIIVQKEPETLEMKYDGYLIDEENEHYSEIGFGDLHIQNNNRFDNIIKSRLE